jgi:endonuclease/exonuclease/phosphatase family metal-dependent hydrolase
LIPAQALPIGIDGRFSDWDNATANYTDSQGDGADYDLLSFSVSNDSAYLYIKFALSDEILLNDNNNLRLQIDGDNNASTGYAINGIGSELGFVFGDRFGYFDYGPGTVNVYHDNLNFVALPTVTSDTFELAIGRDVLPDGSTPLFTSNTIKLCFVDNDSGGDWMPNSGNTFSYTFDDTPVETYIPIAFEKENESDLRLMTFNTLFDGLIDGTRVNSFKRIITAVNPDIITFNECWDTQSSQARTLLNTWLPIAGGSWECVYGVYGNITCSKYDLTDTYTIVVTSDNGYTNRIAATLIDLPTDYPRDIMVINTHLKASGGDEPNYIRQEEADAIIRFIRDIKTSGGALTLPFCTPFVISGDLNLVGNSQQLTTLLTGDIVNNAVYGPDTPPDWDNTDLRDNISFQSDQRKAFTWQDNSGSFWPGRLDYAISTESGFHVAKAFTVNTAVMSPERLSLYGLQSGDSQTASDHFAKVTDFYMDATIAVNDILSPHTGFVVPSISNGDFKIEANGPVTLEAFDISGKLIMNQHINGTTNIYIPNPGMYLMKITDNSGSKVQKIIVQ